jgi:hypothetical protein
MSRSDKERLAQKYETSVQVIENSYREIARKTDADLQRGAAAHAARCDAMRQDFARSAK